MSPLRRNLSPISTTVIPKKYKITFKIDLTALTFIGKVIIDLMVTEKINKIQLNASELNITSIVFKSSSQEVIPNDIKISEETEILQIGFETPICYGEGQLHISYEAALNDKMRAFFRSKYLTPQKTPKYAAITQFESINARKAFPCWDEPAIKAIFKITLIVPKECVALSNMDEISNKIVEKDPTYKKVKFALSPPMSTYLVACVVGQYGFVEGTTPDDVKIRVFTPVSKEAQGKFALEVAIKAITFFRDYFSVAYPLPKLDIVAVSDINSSANENWGLIICRETCVLIDEQQPSTERKQLVARVISQEIAHQWFGSLVTMKWWTHLWLSEGFALYIQYVCVHQLFPEFDIWTQFLTDTVAKALDLDALQYSHPIEIPVDDPADINLIYDEISFDKAASILRMLQNYIGDDAFKRGLHLYLTNHAFGCAVTEDLWAAFEEVSKKPITSIMSMWTKQKGFPVIQVSSKQEENNRVITFKQRKFCANGKISETDYAASWIVPINLSTAKNYLQVVTILLEAKEVEIILEDIKHEHWIKVNPSTIGFYRVLYSSSMLNQLLVAVKIKDLPALDRFDLISDLFAMVQASLTPTVQLFKLIDSFVNEDDYNVWNVINSCIGKLNVLLSHTDFQHNFHVYGRTLFHNIYKNLGWEPKEHEPHLQSLLRNLVIRRLVSFEEPSVITEAKSRFDASCKGIKELPFDLGHAVYRAVVAHCDDKTFESLFQLYRRTELLEDKNRIAVSLGCVLDEAKIKIVLNFALSDEVPPQDSVFIIISVAMTKPGRSLAWTFFQEKYDELVQRYGGTKLMSYLIKNCTENFASEDKWQEVSEFFKKNPAPGMERTVQQSLESISLNSEWLARDRELIQTYISAKIDNL